MNKLYFDMDGTLMQFVDCKDGDWNLPGFFINQIPYWAMCAAVNKMAYEYPDNCFVLTATPATAEARLEKLAVCSVNIPNMRIGNIISSPLGQPKSSVFSDGVKSNMILIDDFTRNILDWSRAGGTAAKCITPRNNHTHKWEGHFISAVDSPCAIYNTLRHLLLCTELAT